MGARTSRGFTLVELVMVMVLIGVLAVFAMPRMLDLTAWRLRAYADALQAQTPAMQRRALSQRRPITATVRDTGVVFTDAGTTVLALPCPTSASPCIGEPGPRSVVFNAANTGRVTTSTGSALVLTIGTGSAQRRLQIEHETGLIRPAP